MSQQRSLAAVIAAREYGRSSEIHGYVNANIINVPGLQYQTYCGQHPIVVVIIICFSRSLWSNRGNWGILMNCFNSFSELPQSYFAKGKNEVCIKETGSNVDWIFIAAIELLQLCHFVYSFLVLQYVSSSDLNQ